MANHWALREVFGTSTDRRTTWNVEDGVLHVTVTDVDGDSEHLHYRLVQIEQVWQEVQP